MPTAFSIRLPRQLCETLCQTLCYFVLKKALPHYYNHLSTMKKLTKAEEELMHIIWALRECTVGDIRDHIEQQLGQPRPPHSTISTMVRILDDKGFVDHRTYGRTFVYTPKVSKEEYSRQSLSDLVSDYFGGSVNRLVSFLVKKNDLSLEELNELITRLEEEE